MAEEKCNASDNELASIVTALKSGLDIKDRKYLFKTYSSCFIGCDAITFMISNNICSSREEGVSIGKQLLTLNIIQHVTNDHNFLDDKKFYEFLPENNGGSSFRIIYYGFGGRAEALRLTATLGGISFEDEYITSNQQSTEKADGKRRWSGPPEIVILCKKGNDLQRIGQSNACLRYIGDISGLYPQNRIKRALVDEILDSSEDLAGNIVMGAIYGEYKNDEEKKEKFISLLKDDGSVTYWLNKFELRLQENEKKGNQNGLFVADNISIADLKAYFALGYTRDNLPGARKEMVKYKRITSFLNLIENDERIQAAKQKYDKNFAAFKENPDTKIFKYCGKCIYGVL